MKPSRFVIAAIIVGIIALGVALNLNGPPEGGLQDGGQSGQMPGALEPAAGIGAAPAATVDGVPGGDLRAFTIDPEASEVYWRIYRAGAAARLGHNHVISMGEMEGTVLVGEDPASAQWSLSFPVAGLVVDEPALRARYGEDFESVPSDDDKAGTRTNMLTEGVLNGDVFPEIRLSGTGFSGTTTDARLPVTIEMLGRSVEQTFPASVVFGDDSVTVSGELRLTHADLGMEPFSIFGGLMAVGEDIDFTYRIHAVAGD